MFNWIKNFIIEHHLLFKEIEYFHPNGKNMPNGIYYQRGCFLHECQENEHKFMIYDDQGNNIAFNKGYVIVFPTNAIITFPIHKYRHGNYFDGQYIGADQDRYDKKSMCIYIDDMSLTQALKFAINIASKNNIHHVIVKASELNKIYRGNIC